MIAPRSHTARNRTLRLAARARNCPLSLVSAGPGITILSIGCDLCVFTGGCGRRILAAKISKVCVPAPGGVVMAKYMALFNLTSEAIRRFGANPSDRAAVVR